MPATTQRIRAELNQLPAGQPVGYADFVHEPAEFGAVAAALSRLSKRGELKRLAKGVYYQPMTEHLGTMLPMQAVVVAGLRSCFRPASPLPYRSSRL
jgi:hypothetical protein